MFIASEIKPDLLYSEKNEVFVTTKNIKRKLLLDNCSWKWVCMHSVLTWNDAAAHLRVAKFPFVPRDVKMGNLHDSFFAYRLGKKRHQLIITLSPPLSIVFFKTTTSR